MKNVIKNIANSYTSYMQKMLKSHAFTFAMVVVPVSSLSAIEIPHSTPNEPYKRLNVIEQAVITPQDSDANLALDEIIVFDFSKEMDPQKVFVDIFPKIDVDKKWNEDLTKLSIKPKHIWASGERYTVALTEHIPESAGRLYNFVANGYPKVTHQSILPDQLDFVLDEEASLDVSFDRDIEQYDFKAVAKTPLVITHEKLTQERTLRISFGEAIDETKKVTLVLYAKHKLSESEEFYPVGDVTFIARTPSPEAWPEEQEERVELSRLKTIPKITQGKYVDVNIDMRVTTLFENGLPIDSFTNIPDAGKIATPVGEFKVENKGLRPISKKYGVYLPFWIAFTPDGLHGMHDLVEWPADHPDYPESFKDGKETLTKIRPKISPGSIRHGSEQSTTLYDWADIGTPIIIY